MSWPFILILSVYENWHPQNLMTPQDVIHGSILILQTGPFSPDQAWVGGIPCSSSAVLQGLEEQESGRYPPTEGDLTVDVLF